MKHIHRSLRLLAIPAACLLAATTAPAEPLLLEPPVQDGTSLSDYIEAPEVYFELFDLGALERDVRATGLGRMSTQLLPFFEQGLDEADMPDEVATIVRGTLVPMLGGDLSWEDGIATTIADVLEFKLGMASSDAVSVAAAVGARMSFAMDLDFGAGDQGEHWAMAWALRPGGDAAITDLLLPRIAQEAKVNLAEKTVHLERDASGAYGAWSVDEGLVVVRPGIMAMVSDRAMADRLLNGAVADDYATGSRRPVVTQFQMKRNDAMGQNNRAWLFVSGDLGAVKLEQEGEQERAAAEALGLDLMGDFEASLSTQNGQMLSRVRIEKRGPGGLLGLARGRAAEWKHLKMLTADSLVVAGIPQSPSVLIGDLTGLIAKAEATAGGSDVAMVGAMMQQNPILSALSDRGAFQDESVLFVRPGAAGIPMVYLAAGASPSLEQALADLAGYEVAGAMMSVRTKEIDGQPAWIVSTPDMGKQWGLALMRRDEGVIASYSLLALQAYARQRSREHVEDRDALISGVRAQLAAGLRSGASANVAGFCHVRVEPLAEWVWPMALMGLSMSGVEGIEDLPDAVELAEQIGDTTLILYEFDDHIEMWGRGLLGGLGILF